MPTKKVVIATNNAHKLDEISRMLAPVTGLARVCAAPAEGLARTVQAIADQKAA